MRIRSAKARGERFQHDIVCCRLSLLLKMTQSKADSSRHDWHRVLQGWASPTKIKAASCALTEEIRLLTLRDDVSEPANKQTGAQQKQCSWFGHGGADGVVGQSGPVANHIAKSE